LTTEIYGFTKKTPQGKDQQTQTAQEAALESSQEAHLAEVILSRQFFHPFARDCILCSPRTVFIFAA
jgi:hypothetical protein